MTTTNTEQILAVVENTSRTNILADIVGHPHGLPTRQELEHMNPSSDSQTLSNHFGALEDAGSSRGYRTSSTSSTTSQSRLALFSTKTISLPA